MKAMKRILVCLLCLAMLVPMLVACAGDAMPTDESTTPESDRGGEGNGGLPSGDIPDATVEGAYGLFFDGAFVISELDEQGRLSVMWELNEYLMINPVPLCEFIYDESGRLIYANIENDPINFYYDGDRITCDLYGEETEIRIDYYKNGSLKSLLAYEYDNVWEGYYFDSQGRMILGGEFDENGNLLGGLTATYEKQKLVLMSSHDGEISDEKIIVKLDAQGNPIGIFETESDEPTEEEGRVWTWENGRVVSCRWLSMWWHEPAEGSGEEGWSETVENIATLTYDENGRCIRAEITENGELTETETFTYDENGYRIFDESEGNAYKYIYKNGRVTEYVRYYKQNYDFPLWSATRFDVRTGATLSKETWYIGGTDDTYTVQVNEYIRDVPEGALYKRISKYYDATATGLGGELTRVSKYYTLNYQDQFGTPVDEATGEALRRDSYDGYGNFLNDQGEIVYYQKYMDDSGKIFYYTADGVMTFLA